MNEDKKPSGLHAASFLFPWQVLNMVGCFKLSFIQLTKEIYVGSLVWLCSWGMHVYSSFLCIRI